MTSDLKFGLKNIVPYPMPGFLRALRNPCLLFLLVLLVSYTSCWGQITRNRKPKIIGQQELSVNEDESITIKLSNLEVEDRDDWFYPYGFTLKVHAGTNYTFSEHTVTPVRNFSGTLKVQVTVNDGDDDSDPYELMITVNPVNDPPKITGQVSLSTLHNKPLLIQLTDLIVEDPDNAYPTGFLLTLFSGENYEILNHEVTPATGFLGSLSVPVSVSDGVASSENFNLSIQVNQLPSQGGKLPEGDLTIPSGFTPNGDRSNDTWVIQALKNADAYNNAVIRVYTKSGRLVYEATGINKEWDGRFNGDFLPAGVYFFTIDVDPLYYARSSLRGVVTILR